MFILGTFLWIYIGMYVFVWVSLCFVLVLWFHAMSVTEVFPGEWKSMEPEAERVSLTAKSIARWKRRRDCPASQNQAITTGACVLLDVLVWSPWTHYWTWSWPWCPLNFLTHLSALTDLCFKSQTLGFTGSYWPPKRNLFLFLKYNNCTLTYTYMYKVLVTQRIYSTLKY